MKRSADSMSTSTGSDNWLKVINIAIAPLAVAMAGVIILWLRRTAQIRSPSST